MDETAENDTPAPLLDLGRLDAWPTESGELRQAIEMTAAALAVSTAYPWGIRYRTISYSRYWIAHSGADSEEAGTEEYKVPENLPQRPLPDSRRQLAGYAVLFVIVAIIIAINMFRAAEATYGSPEIDLPKTAVSSSSQGGE